MQTASTVVDLKPIVDQVVLPTLVAILSAGVPCVVGWAWSPAVGGGTVASLYPSSIGRLGRCSHSCCFSLRRRDPG